MRTNIELDEELIREAMRLTGLATKRAVVEEALRELVRARRRDRLAEAFGSLRWDGDLDAMRRDR
jgi:Arc/MetJ family transcription regulator